MHVEMRPSPRAGQQRLPPAGFPLMLQSAASCWRHQPIAIRSTMQTCPCSAHFMEWPAGLKRQPWNLGRGRRLQPTSVVVVGGAIDPTANHGCLSSQWGFLQATGRNHGGGWWLVVSLVVVVFLSPLRPLPRERPLTRPRTSPHQPHMSMPDNSLPTCMSTYLTPHDTTRHRHRHRHTRPTPDTSTSPPQDWSVAPTVRRRLDLSFLPAGGNPIGLPTPHPLPIPQRARLNSVSPLAQCKALTCPVSSGH